MRPLVVETFFEKIFSNALVDAVCRVTGSAAGKLSFVFILIALMSGCNAASKVEFTAEPETVNAGETSTLSWSVVYAEGATDITMVIEPELGDVDLIGTASVTPVETTEYTLTTTAMIKDALKTTTELLTVTVIPAPPLPEILDFGFYQGDTRAGEPVELHWSVVGADNISILPSDDVLSVDDTGVFVSPMEQTTYTLTAENENGLVTAEVVVDVTFTDLNTSMIWPEELKQCVELAAQENNWQFNEQVTEVRCADKKIEDFAGIELFNNLRVLDLSDNYIEELNLGYSMSSRLEEVYLSGNMITQVSSLSQLSTLTHLDLSGNPISDQLEIINVLDNNKNISHLLLNDIVLTGMYFSGFSLPLEVLEIENVGLRDLDVISGILTLKELNVANNVLEDLQPLIQLQSLEVLNVNGNFLKSLEGIIQLNSLVSLDVSHNPNLDKISLADVINNNKGLKTLFLADMPLDSLSDLGGVFVEDGGGKPADFQLKGLNIDSTRLNDVAALVSQPGLVDLSFRNNSINVFPDFSQLTFLELLAIGDTGFDDYGLLSPIAGGLKELDVSDNILSGEFPFGDFVGLTSLDIGGLNLKQLVGIELIVGLEKLNVSNNRLDGGVITWLLSAISGLTDLDMSGNTVSDSYLMFDQFDTLINLNLSDMELDGFSGFSGLYFSNLKGLNVSNNPVLGADGLSGLEWLRLRELDISHTQVTLNDFDVRAIKSLNVRDSKTSSTELISKLATMPLLETLIVSDLYNEQWYQDPYSLLQSIQQPQRLRKLDVAGMYREGPLSLYQFNNLRWLSVQGSDYSAADSSIAELDGLRHLDMSSTRLSSMMFPKNIHELLLAGNAGFVGDLSSVATLTHLDVSGDISLDINDIHQVITNSPAIKNISVANLGLENISDVISFGLGTSKIESLDLSRNHITFPGDLALFSGLKELSINDNPIVDLTFSNQLHNLEYLDVGHTYSTTLPDFTNLNKLKHLDVSYLPIADTGSVFSQVANVNNLSYLDVSGIDLRNQYLSMLDGLPLVTLKLADTHIDSADFNQLDDIEVLDLSNNKNLELGLMPSSLRELYLRYSTGFDFLTGELNNLKAFDVSYTDLQFNDVQNVLSNTKQLHTLGIAGIDVPDYYSLYDVVGDNQLSLRYLDVSDLTDLELSGLNVLVGLEHLIARNIKGGYSNLFLENLLELDLSGSDVDPNNVEVIIGLNLGLHTLRLNDIDLSDIDVFSALEQNNTQLMELELKGTGAPQVQTSNQTLFQQLIRLNLSGTHLVELPAALMSPTLEYLDISHNDISNLAGLPAGLVGLNAGFNPIEYGSDVAGLVWLGSLSLTNTNVDNADFLYSLLNLQSLNLSLTNISDKTMLMDSIAGLGLLQELDLSGLNLVGASAYDADFNLDLPNLHALNISGTGIVNIDVSLLPRLISLDISHNPVANVWGGDLQLETLNVSHTFLTEIPFSMESIRSLYVGYSQMEVSQVLDAIQYKDSLLALDIAGLKRNDIYWLGGLDSYNGDFKKLEYLDVSDMGVHDFGWMSGYVSLTTLKAENNFINYLWGLEQKNLRHLDLSGNPITMISELEAVLMNNQYLESIGLNDIPLNAFDFFGVLDQFNTVEIKELKLSNTGLQDWDVPNLSKYQALDHLEIANNKLEYVPSFALLSNLSVLDVSGNLISDVDFVLGDEGYRSWKFLDLSNNPIDASYLLPLLDAVEIKGLGVAGLINIEGIQQWSGLSQLAYLDVSNTGLSYFDVSTMLDLQVLKIEGNHIEWLNLANAHRLTELNVANNRLTDDFVSNLPMNIQKLNLSNNIKLSSLDNIGYMESIVELRLSGLRLEQSNLFNWQGALSQKAHQIRVLDVSSTDLMDPSINAFQYLKELNISDTTFYSPFYGANQAFLEKLYIANLELDQYFSLQGFTLKELDISGYSGIDLSGVLSGVGANGLTALYLNNVVGGGSDGGNVSGTLNEMYPIYEQRSVLRTLELGGTNTSDLSLLDGFVNLEAVSLRDNQLTDIAVLSQYQNLNSIDVYGNQLTDVSPLHNLFGLRSLDVGNNSGIVLSDIDVVLQNNPEITVLGLNGITLGTTDFTLAVSPRLSWLDIGNTGITQFNTAGVLLQTLNISENNIEQAPGVFQLKKLNISNNDLTDIFGLLNFSGLAHLDISENTLIPLPDLQLLLSNQTDLISINVSGIALASFSDLGLSAGWGAGPLVNLDLSDTGIVELGGVEQFTALRALNLSGNTGVDCTYLDVLNRPGLVVTRPEHCPVL